ncbi:Bug family tripartite tricarboxylate transporter substrate binding protein [Caldovatus sediminis]|nr:tripartite tricarboxylate transporter substrate binding protein [Caldovatus sediminis]
MPRPARRHLLLAPAAAAAPAGAQPAATAPWPARPVRMVVAYPAGGSTDITARLMAERLSRAWGQPVVVENRAGAAGTIGADSVAKSPPDGHTLLMAASPEIAIARSTQRNLPYDPVRDFAPVMLVGEVPFLLVVNPSVPARTLAELIALAKSQPGRLNYASFGIGTSSHLVGELFRTTAGVDITHVPYRGSAPAMTDLIAGQVQMAFDTIPAALPHVREGRLRAIAVATPERSPLAPDVPTFGEAGLPGFTGGTWIGLVAPAATPAPVVARIWQDADALMREGLAAALRDRGLEPRGLGPEPFRRFIEAEVGKWSAVAERAGIRPE